MMIVRVLFILTLPYASEVLCGRVILRNGNEICQDDVVYLSSPANDSSSKSLIRTKRQLPAPTVAYYDFLVNEFSFKVWAVFEVVTIALLFYSTFAAIYYARWTYLRADPADEGFLRRSHERFIRALERRW